MTISEVYHQSLKKLKKPQFEEINIRILLSEINDIDSMSDFYIRQDEEVKDLQRFNELFERFLNGEPIQYLINKANFYGYDFYVDKRVLIPRMESEEVVSYAIDKAKDILGDFRPTIIDVCCGSGCLGITLARALNAKALYLSDISKDAVDVTKINLERNNIDGEVFVGDGLAPFLEKKITCDILIANPPYIINRNDTDESVVKHEPHIALFANKKLQVYDQIISNLSKIKNHPFIAVFEIGYDIKALLESMVRKYLPKCDYEFAKDMEGNYRILSISLK